MDFLFTLLGWKKQKKSPKLNWDKNTAHIKNGSRISTPFPKSQIALI